jgi:branched-chain amino acid transport system ATP-binding protein
MSAAEQEAMSPAGPDAAPVLRVDGVARRFGGVAAVDDVSLTLAPGERLAVIGPNGAGKTTLCRLIAGEVPVSKGSIELFGKDVTRWPARRRARLGLARTFQVSTLFSQLTVAENVALAAQSKTGGRWRCWPTRRAPHADRIDAILDSLLLAARRGDVVAELSHGERRQLEIAMSLVVTPSLLLLDEPAAGLSVVERARLREVIASLPRTIPLLLIEHDLTFALGLADRALCLENGIAIANGTPDEIRAHPKVREVYLGRSAAGTS